MLGANIKAARKEAGLTQKELAEKLSVTQKDVSRWEGDLHVPGIDYIVLICQVLDVSADVLLDTGINHK